MELAQVVTGQPLSRIEENDQFPVPLESQVDPLAYLTRSSFLAYVNSIFLIGAELPSIARADDGHGSGTLITWKRS